MTTTLTTTLRPFGEATIGTYRRPASCGATTRRHAPRVAAAVPNYVRRRVVAAVVAAVASAGVVVSAGSLLASFGGEPAIAAEASPVGASVAPAVHVARPGDTLWSIAERYRGEVDQTRFVDALVRLNDGASIEAGQAVRLP